MMKHVLLSLMISIVCVHAFMPSFTLRASRFNKALNAYATPDNDFAVESMLYDISHQSNEDASYLRDNERASLLNSLPTAAFIIASMAFFSPEHALAQEGAYGIFEGKAAVSIPNH